MLTKQELKAIEAAVMSMSREELERRVIQLAGLLSEHVDAADLHQRLLTESLKGQFWALWMAHMATVNPPVPPQLFQQVNSRITMLNDVAATGTQPEFAKYVHGFNESAGAKLVDG